MDKLLESEINALITRRILNYNRKLIKTGQIEDVPLEGPSAIHPSSYCSQPVCMRMDGLPVSPVLYQDDPLQ